jgi:hypothetical protein
MFSLLSLLLFGRYMADAASPVSAVSWVRQSLLAKGNHQFEFIGIGKFARVDIVFQYASGQKLIATTTGGQPIGIKPSVGKITGVFTTAGLADQTIDIMPAATSTN